jgi:hypothetical protein
MRLAPPSGERGRARGYPRLYSRDGAGRAGCLRTHLPWLDDTFLESLTQKDNTASVVRVNATTFARSPVTTLTWVANYGSMARPLGIKLAGGALYYGGYAVWRGPF